MMLQIVSNTKTQEAVNSFKLDVRYDQAKPAHMYIVFTSEATAVQFVVPAMRVGGKNRYISLSFTAAKLGHCAPGASRLDLSSYPEGQYHWDAYSASDACDTSGGTLYLSGMAYLKPLEGALAEPSTFEFQPTNSSIVMFEP